MIKINKSGADKPDLTYKSGKNQGKCRLQVATDELIQTYQAEPLKFKSPSERKPHNVQKTDFSGPYNDVQIKLALKRLQHNKCCFCERPMDKKIAEVEHFRPKASYRASKLDTDRYPGYFWLAYDWDNLIYACRTCNGEKGTFFPLADEQRRADPNLRDITDEHPLLINPSQIEPRKHVFFDKWIARPLSSSPEGTETINILDLNRSVLLEDRKDHFNMMFQALKLIQVGPKQGLQTREDIEALKQQLIMHQRPDQKYSAMVVDLVQSVGLPKESWWKRFRSWILCGLITSVQSLFNRNS